MASSKNIEIIFKNSDSKYLGNQVENNIIEFLLPSREEIHFKKIAVLIHLHCRHENLFKATNLLNKLSKYLKVSNSYLCYKAMTKDMKLKNPNHKVYKLGNILGF